MGKVVKPRTLEHDDRIAARARLELAHEFDLVDPVGEGPGTALFAARERGSGRDVMVKVIARPEQRPDADALFRAALAAQVTYDHPHLVPVLRYGATDSLFWFTRANIRATPLADVLAQGSRLDERRARHLATQAASALEYLHRRGAVHGALTTRNVLLDPAGWVHLCDAAIDLSRRRTTPASTDIDGPATDQQALAAVIRDSLDGEPSAAMARALARALSADPRERFPRLGDFIGALESGASANMPASTPANTPANSPRRPTPTRPTRRTSDAVLFVPDWEAPHTHGRGRLVRVALIACVALVAAAIVLPRLMAFLRPPPPPRVVSPQAPGQGAPPAAPAPQATTPTPATAASPPAAAAPRPAPRPPALLFINSQPWGRVLIDGVAIGNTPRANVVVESGARTIRIERDGFIPYERRLNLAPGDTVRLTDIVLAERPR